MSNIKENDSRLLDFIGRKYQANEISDEGLVQIIELCGSYLNLKSISDYAKENNMSYNGAKKGRNIIELFGNRFVCEND